MKIINKADWRYKNLPGREMWKILDKDNNGIESMSVCLVKIPKGEIVRPEHAHKETDEFIYIIHGNGEIYINKKKYEIFKNTGILVQEMEMHYIKNTGNSEMEALCIFVPPSSVEKYILNHKDEKTNN